MARDFAEARRRARGAGDTAVGDQLDAIIQQAAQLEQIFDDLKLSDQATYDSLTEIVRGATDRNEAIATVIDRIRVLGAVGQELAEKIGDITSGGALAVLRGALKL